MISTRYVNGLFRHVGSVRDDGSGHVFVSRSPSYRVPPLPQPLAVYKTRQDIPDRPVPTTLTPDKPRVRTMLLVLLLLHGSRVVEPSARWQEHQHPEERYHLERLTDRDAARTMDRLFDERSSWINDSDRPLPFAAQSSLSSSSSLSSLSSALSSEQRKRITADAEEPDDPTLIRVSVRSRCSCESQYEIRDLGDDHYPRYLTASRCKPETCHSKFYSCRLLHYMVHVLRLRESSNPSKTWYSNDNTLPETPLPESLRHKWQLKPISVAVACVSATNTRRN